MSNYIIYICNKCKKQLSEEIMGKKCPYCGEWTYHKDCKKEVILIEEFNNKLEQLKKDLEKYKIKPKDVEKFKKDCDLKNCKDGFIHSHSWVLEKIEEIKL